MSALIEIYVALFEETRSPSFHRTIEGAVQHIRENWTSLNEYTIADGDPDGAGPFHEYFNEWWKIKMFTIDPARKYYILMNGNTRVYDDRLVIAQDDPEANTVLARCWGKKNDFHSSTSFTMTLLD